MKLIIVSCLLAVTYAVAERPVVLCGRQLANARALLCYGNEYPSKRSPIHSILSEYLTEARNNDMTWPWGGRYGALTADWTRYNKRDGLVDECCLKPCTRDVILNYC
ncbi:bombyxin F-1-like [Anticarsia gemmatalis]|uniref:bombyxin F-1-like n=1 Tax=Anticarsia gemmatalis TaxID=129554 RepID=UPI003F75C866